MVMKKAQNTIYGDRGSAFALGMIEDICTLLSGVLQPLGDVLVEMIKILLDAYQSSEEVFDGSKVLLVFLELRRCPQLLVKQAHSLGVTPPAILQKLNKEDIKRLDAIKGQEEMD